MTGRRAVLVLLVLTVAVAFSGMPGEESASAAAEVLRVAEPPEPSPGAPPEPPPEQQEPEPSPEPSPEPGPEPSPPEEDPDTPTEEPCGPFDYGCMAEEAFYGWGLSLVTSLIGMKLVDTAVGMLSTPIPAGGIEEGWRVSLAVTNTAYVLVVTIAGVLVMTNPTVQASASLKEVKLLRFGGQVPAFGYFVIERGDRSAQDPPRLPAGIPRAHHRARPRRTHPRRARATLRALRPDHPQPNPPGQGRLRPARRPDQRREDRAGPPAPGEQAAARGA